MDAKSLARSKRAHTQHLNKKHHPNPKSKSPSTAAATEGNPSKPPGKQTGQKPRQAHASSSSKLPSNWDRYGEDEEDLGVGSEDQSLDGAETPSDVVLPKSKGADFTWLVSEAKTQNSSNLEFFPNLQDVLPDFDQAASSMLSVRGKGILSWIGDDSFIVDDDASAGYEASFLSMDLHALAAALEKIDLSRRLFIEEDLLPPELCAGGSSDITNQELEKAETAVSGHASQRLDEFTMHGHADLDQESKDMLSTATSSDSPVPIFRSSQTSPSNPLKGDSEQFVDNDLTSILDSLEQFKDIPVLDSSEKTSTFEALAAEAELDMLLNSFGETSLLDSSNISKNPASSSLLPQRGGSSSILGGFAAGNSSSKHTVYITNPTEIIPKKVNLNDSIDEILAETSNPMNQKNGGILPQGLRTNPLDVPSLSTSSTGSKALEDFESWLDTI